jgi:GT2 family glycosyltransferase
MNTTPEVSIIIVNTNTCDWLGPCLQSLRLNDDVSAQVIVVENQSEDGSEDMVRQQFPEVELVCNSERYGFSKNNNIGAQIAQAPLLLFLNPDTEMPPGSLRQMIDAIAAESPVYGVFGFKIYDADNLIERSTGAFPTLVSVSLDKALDKMAILRPLLQRFSQRHFLGYDCRREVDWVTGACLWIRREVFAKVDGWDSDIFLYYEDADLCYRVRQTGMRSLYLPGISMFHYHNKTPMALKRRKQLMINGLHIFVQKHYGTLRAGVYRFFIGRSKP